MRTIQYNFKSVDRFLPNVEAAPYVLYVVFFTLVHAYLLSKLGYMTRQNILVTVVLLMWSANFYMAKSRRVWPPLILRV